MYLHVSNSQDYKNQLGLLWPFGGVDGPKSVPLMFCFHGLSAQITEIRKYFGTLAVIKSSDRCALDLRRLSRALSTLNLAECNIKYQITQRRRTSTGHAMIYPLLFSLEETEMSVKVHINHER